MKKIRQLTSILLFCMCLLLAGCTISFGDTSAEPTTIIDAHESNIFANLYQKVPALNVRVSDNEGRFDLTVDVETTGKVSNFGIYILEVREAFENEFSEDERGSFSVNLPIKGEPSTIIRFSGVDYAESLSPLSGTIYDSRSGELVTYKVTGEESLCELFPATSTHIAKDTIAQDDLRIYEEVMDILNEQMDRPEDEILEEIAPDYGMTAAELKQFMVDTMSKIYSAGSDSSP